ncbi:J domain-containing protein [Aromatoleum buckelii]|uniref:DnaJ domain-containing protein n=1 Tax=Aromatoleum buckelii TaxID=200254 RepID=A0ABX1N5P7_9RHOO|nr:J domain-containing protein [Aromatoleum buckelii]MCK0512697.1 DnaJ domain-containing protein [Aromatoleum buckelii]
MSAAGEAGRGGAAALAQAVFAEPTRFGELVRGGGALPADTLVVMRTAAEAVRDGRQHGLDEHRRAALFFVEHVLLAYEADHYRVLGLTRDATADQIREHYRVMMGIFHPDRQGWADSDREKLSARINLAHHVLRDDQRRAAYDLERTQARPRVSVSIRIVSQAERKRAAGAAPTLTERLPLTMRRNFPQYVLGSVALVGFVAVLAVYLNRAPAGAIGASRPSPKAPVAAAPAERAAPVTPALVAPPLAKSAEAAPMKVPEAARPKVMPAAAQKPPGAANIPAPASAVTADRAPVETPPVAAIFSAREPVPEPEAAPAVRTARPPAVVDKPLEVAAAPVALPPPRPLLQPETQAEKQAEAQGETQPSPVQLIPAPALAPARAAEAPAPATPPAEAPVPPGLTASDAARVLGQFSSSYQLGDIERFMKLFTEDARSGTGRRAQIRKDYEQLFSSTQARRIELIDMRWSPDSASLRGEGGYLVRIRRGDGVGEEVFAGSIRMELTRRGQDVLISGLFHKPSD